MRGLLVADTARSTRTLSASQIIDNGSIQSAANMKTRDATTSNKSTAQTTATSGKNGTKPSNSSASDTFKTIDGEPLLISTHPPTTMKAKDGADEKTKSKTKDAKSEGDDSKNSNEDKPNDSYKRDNPYSVPVAYDDDDTNTTYTWNHYATIEGKPNSTNAPWKSNSLENIATAALEKNLSTTKTPFLPSEGNPPDNWVKIVGGLFGGVAVALIVATVIRSVYANQKRRNYEEIQSLVV